MKGYVYILESEKNKRYYIGSTDDVARRLEQHNAGYVYTTKRMLPVKLVLVQEYESLTKARLIELKIKRLKRKDYINKMVGEGKIKLGL